MTTRPESQADLIAAFQLESLINAGHLTDMAKAASIDKGNAATSRTSANAAAWRTYSPEDCADPINGGSTLQP